MIRARRLFAGFKLLAGGLAALLAVSSASASDTRFEVTQMVRYVLETDEFEGYRAYQRKIVTGELTYEKRYRPPNDPAGPTSVDCTRARRLGVTFLLMRNSDNGNEIARLRARWRHSMVRGRVRGMQDDKPRKDTFGTGSEILDDDEVEIRFWEGDDARVGSYGVVLTDKVRVDGIMSVVIKEGPDIILENSFELIGCPATS